MTTAFTRTREELAAMVLRKLAVLAAGGTANANDLTVVYEAIDLRLKEMHRHGIFWRKVTKLPISFTLSAATTQASAGVSDILFPVSMTARNLSMDDPIEIIGVRQYAAIENKGNTGVPEMALYDGSAGFVFWPVPLANITVNLVYEKIADDTATSTAPDVDVAMMRWLRDIIAYDLGDDFGKTDQTMMRWRQECIYAEQQIRKLNVEHVDNETVSFDNY